MNHFFVYEEYGAKYELMIKDVASTYRTMPQWELYQKGLEALASSLASINSQHDKSKKALTIGDLLVKASNTPLSIVPPLLMPYSPSKEFAGIRFCSRNFSDKLPSVTVPILIWRSRMFSSDSEKQQMRSIVQRTTRG